MKLNRAKLYQAFRKKSFKLLGTSLSQSQVRGIEGILDAFEKYGDGREKTLAYALATTRREVGSGMVPVREGFAKTDKAARLYILKHYPNKSYAKIINGHMYYGRGIAQLTHYPNYLKEGIADNPDKALEPEFAARILIQGIQDGRWNGQGRGIRYYLPSIGNDDLRNARRTVNITDHWQEVGSNYKAFLSAIQEARE